MSDTRQTVHWWFVSDEGRKGYVWAPAGRERPDDVLWRSIRRIGIEPELRMRFHITDPLWYGLWIESPLSQEQCCVLLALFSEAAKTSARWQEALNDFITALREATQTGESLHVELSSPGHVDMGWITTFVHCPRCKAEGPVERWQESYATEPIACPVCGHWYSPAATHSAMREYFAESLDCRSCGASYKIREFSTDEIEVLENHHYYHGFCTELGWLRRVAAFYQRYPRFERQIKPHFEILLESNDPQIQDDLCAGVPFDEIALPAGARPIEASRDWSADELEVIQYLQHNSFTLQRRLDFVMESIERLKPLVEASSVACRACGAPLSASGASPDATA